MNRKKYLIIFLIAILTLIIIGVYALNRNNGIKQKKISDVAKDNASVILFYGKECPHCQKLEKHLSAIKATEKIKFSQREVFHNKANANLMVEKAKQCKIEIKELGVPFLWANGRCYLGEIEVSKFFDDKIK